MADEVFTDLKRYVGFSPEDEAALRAFHPVAQPQFIEVADRFYKRILDQDGPRQVLQGGESVVGRLKVSLVAWLERLRSGPWDDDYFDFRCRIGRVHVRIGMPQHYMFGAMNVVRQELNDIVDAHYLGQPDALRATRAALGRILDIELGIMLHTYREDLLAQHARAERLATFGQLVGSIGHELRNPLGVIETSLFILKARLKDDERGNKHADRIAEQLTISNQIITDLLDLVRERPLTRETTLVAPIVASVLDSVRRAPEVTISVDGIAELPPVHGDAGQLRQVFMNIIDNAIFAASPQGEVFVRGAVEDMVVVTVEDTGAGIDPAIRKRLFEPLVTTKVKGIGLGLALVKRIVERHGGSIGVDQRPGRGARFAVRLPRA